VYVSSEDVLYVRDGSEYIIKRYFSPKEVKIILELDNEDQAYHLCKKYNAKQKAPRKKMFVTLPQLKQMINERPDSRRN
jgi:hypothetical protein